MESKDKVAYYHSLHTSQTRLFLGEPHNIPSQVKVHQQRIEQLHPAAMMLGLGWQCPLARKAPIPSHQAHPHAAKFFTPHFPSLSVPCMPAFFNSPLSRQSRFHRCHQLLFSSGGGGPMMLLTAAADAGLVGVADDADATG